MSQNAPGRKTASPLFGVRKCSHRRNKVVVEQVESEGAMPPDEENQSLDFPEVPFPREPLAGAQRQVMSALAATYTGCRAAGPIIPDQSCILIESCTRPAWACDAH